MHVLIHVNLCPLQAQARISRVKRHLWHPDHHTTLFAYIYIKWKSFLFFKSCLSKVKVWKIGYLNVLLSSLWLRFPLSFQVNNMEQRLRLWWDLKVTDYVFINTPTPSKHTPFLREQS